MSLEQWWEEREAATRLAIGYAAIIMAISLIFSAALYRVSASQLDDSLHKQYMRFRVFSSDFLEPKNPAQLQREILTAEQRLQLQLLYLNIIILIVGSASSYWLAKRTLQPIEDALESQSRFTADASHELRTPLTAMQTEIEVALRNPKLSKEDAKALLQSNLEEVAHLRALSEGLLQLASKDNELMLTDVSLEEVTVDALNRVVAAAQAKKIAIENNVGALHVQGDQHSLVELMVIILDNAIKYSGSKTAITMGAVRRGRHVLLSVADQGAGIKPEDLPHIFDRFYRSDSSRSKQRAAGYGLGLSIAHKIAEMHGGTIEVTSTPGVGSTFTLKLPLKKGDI